MERLTHERVNGIKTGYWKRSHQGGARPEARRL